MLIEYNFLLTKEAILSRSGHIYSVVKEVKKTTSKDPIEPYEIVLKDLTFVIPHHEKFASHIEEGDKILIDFEPSQPNLGFAVSWWKNDSFQGEFRITEGNIIT